MMHMQHATLCDVVLYVACNWRKIILTMMTSSNGSIFRVTGPLCGEFTGHRWIPRTKASDAELWLFSLICAWINGWANNREAGDLRRHHAHCDVIIMIYRYRYIGSAIILCIMSMFYNSNKKIVPFQFLHTLRNIWFSGAVLLTRVYLGLEHE